MSIRDEKSRMRVEKMYRCLKLYNVIFMNLFGFVVVPIIYSASAGIIAALYVTCRPSGLPLLTVYCVSR